MAVTEKIKSPHDVVNNFKDFLFYNIHIEKPMVNCLKRLNFLSELSFYEELNVTKTSHMP